MSNKFLNPSGIPELDDLIVRINDNTISLDNHIADTANPHATTAAQVGINTSDDVPEGSTNLYMTPAERTELGFITITQNVNLDDLETDVGTLQTDKIDKDGSIAMTGNFDLGGNDIISNGVTLDTSTSPDNLIVNTTDGVAFDTPVEAKYSFSRNNNPLLVVDGPQNRVEVSSGISTRLNGGLDMNSQNITNASSITNAGGLSTLLIGEVGRLTDVNIQSNGGDWLTAANLTMSALSPAKTIIGVGTGAGGGEIEINPATKTDHLGNLDMFDNEILQCNNIRTNTQPVFTINKNGSNATEIYGNSTIRRMQISNRVSILSGTNLDMGTGNIINSADTNKIDMEDTGFINISSNGTGIIVQETSNGNNIGITSGSAGMVALSGALNIRNEDGLNDLKISKVNGGNILLDNFAGKILLDAKNGSVEINDGKVVYVSDGQMPTSYASDTTYIFVGSRNTASQINLTGLSNVTLMGMSRDSSTIEYTGSGALITTLDEDFTLSNIRIKSAQVDGLVLDAKNVAKNKLLTIQNCEFRNCKNLFDITGYDLVDIEQNIFTFIEVGSTLTPPKGVYTTDVSKLQLTSCEFIRWFQEGATPSTTEFNGDMVFIQGSCGAHNLTNNVFHPQYDQNGIVIDSATTFVEMAINANQFVDVNLNKPTFSILNTNSNADYDNKAVQEANSLLPNLKSRLGMSYYTATPPTTRLTTVNVPVNMVFTTGIINAFDVFGVTVDAVTNIGRITYNRKRPVNFQITGTFEVLFTSGTPTTQNVGVTLAKNGASLFGAGVVSYQALSTAGTDPKQYTFSVIGAAEQNDYFEFQLVSNNLSGSSDFEVRSFLISGIEI